MRRAGRVILPLISALSLAGCTVGPDYARPGTVVDGAETFVHGQQASHEGHSMSRWWESLADPATSELVERALAANTDLQAAAARVLEAMAVYEAVGGLRQPAVGASLSASREVTVLDPGGRNVRTYHTALQPAINVSWRADLFGQLRRSSRAAWAEALAAEASREAITHAIIAEVVRTRVNIATLQRRLALAGANVESRRETLRAVDRRFDRGIASAVELRLARENLAAAQSIIPLLEEQLFVARHALDVLLNVRPATGAQLPQTLPPVPGLESAPLAVPAALLDRRPDLRASEFRAIAGTERIGVAVADLYPNLTLSAGIAARAGSPGDLFRPDLLLANIAGNLVQLIYDGGSRRAEVRAAEARVLASAADYAGRVLNAVREVENALSADRLIIQRIELLRQRVEESTAAERAARERYQRGVESLLSVLEAERRARLAEDELILAQEALWENRIDLHLALGGDWTAARTPPIELDFLDAPAGSAKDGIRQ
jgi:NodT family efflux transporter outer membrane factor (OMF) lipoprotein